jgi:hypothetical protein
MSHLPTDDVPQPPAPPVILEYRQAPPSETKLHIKRIISGFVLFYCTLFAALVLGNIVAHPTNEVLGVVVGAILFLYTPAALFRRPRGFFFGWLAGLMTAGVLFIGLLMGTIGP